MTRTYIASNPDCTASPIGLWHMALAYEPVSTIFEHTFCASKESSVSENQVASEYRLELLESKSRDQVGVLDNGSHADLSAKALKRQAECASVMISIWGQKTVLCWLKGGD